MNVTSTEAKVFAIRSSLSQVIHNPDVNQMSQPVVSKSVSQ